MYVLILNSFDIIIIFRKHKHKVLPVIKVVTADAAPLQVQYFVFFNIVSLWEDI